MLSDAPNALSRFLKSCSRFEKGDAALAALDDDVAAAVATPAVAPEVSAAGVDVVAPVSAFVVVTGVVVTGVVASLVALIVEVLEDSC